MEASRRGRFRGRDRSAANVIRRRPRGVEIPIASVDASPTAEATAVRAGFQEFIAKPIGDYSALKTRLAFWLGPRDSKGKAIVVAPRSSCEQCRDDERRASAA